MTKGDLMKLVLTDEEKHYCDSAIPQFLWKGIDTSLYVYDCRNNVLVNLAERLISSGKLQELVDDKQELKQLKKHAKKRISKLTEKLVEEGCTVEKDCYIDILLAD